MRRVALILASAATLAFCGTALAGLDPTNAYTDGGGTTWVGNATKATTAALVPTTGIPPEAAMLAGTTGWTTATTAALVRATGTLRMTATPVLSTGIRHKTAECARIIGRTTETTAGLV